ncbi:TPA: Gfo/Idh/MocA family oxidoreductase [Candidatus Poribacteria bacterium]|nr:Gfo/Idh/MocA family oxidoreductase [Candidatus Poribacteria bacterium]HIO50678.1 Gfo/Idh/MocA family oxidoreductase [Candidatus Poribacteria bacterium]
MIVKVGAIGAGSMASGHFNNLNEFEDVEFVAFCDISEDRARQRCQEYGGNAYTDFAKMYDKERLDAVYICTPPFAHGQSELMAIERGIQIFVEKPIATTMETAHQINEAIENSSTISSVGYHWRYQSNVDKAIEVLDGVQIIGAMGYWMGGMPGVGWWRTREGSGGQHVEQTTHIFDLCRYLVGSNVVAVHGFAADGSMSDIPNYDVDDMSIINIQFANGTIANITSACMLKGFGRVKLEIFSNGLVVDVSSGSIKINREDETETYANEVNGYQHEDRVFINAVKSKNGSKIRSPYEDALKTLQITLAASESFITGKQVDLT